MPSRLAQNLAQQDTVVEEIVARVNNSIITRADLRRNREQTAQDAKDQNLSQKAIEERDANSLRDLIDQQLLIQKAADLGISADADLVKRLDDLRKEMKAGSMEDLQKLAEAQGVSWEEFKQNTKNGILTQKVIGSEVGSHIQVTREEIQKFYDEHKSEISQPERVRLSEILIANVPGAPKPEPGKESNLQEPTAEQVAAAEAKANDIYQQLKGGAKFDETRPQEIQRLHCRSGWRSWLFQAQRSCQGTRGQDLSSLRSANSLSPSAPARDSSFSGSPTTLKPELHPSIASAIRFRSSSTARRCSPLCVNTSPVCAKRLISTSSPATPTPVPAPTRPSLIYTSDSGPKTKQVRGKLGVGKKKTVVVVGKDKNDHKPTGSTSELGLAKAEVDAKERAENDRKAAAAAAAAKAAADAAEKEKLSHMSPKERSQYLAEKKQEAKKEAKLEKKEPRSRKSSPEKEKPSARRKQAQAAKSGKKPEASSRA